MPRVLCHFSCGAASAIATYLALAKYGKDNCEILNIEIAEEHPDNQRFLKDCEAWFGKKITTVINGRFNGSIYKVFEQGFIKGQHGAACTTQLKRKVRAKYQLPNDIHVFGYTLEEQDRADDFNENNPTLATDWILINEGVTKPDCLAILQAVGIELPAMYKMGYKNNNCIGCVKGAMGYWNKIRKDFPDTFNRMAKLEREREILPLTKKRRMVKEYPFFLMNLTQTVGVTKKNLVLNADSSVTM